MKTTSERYIADFKAKVAMEAIRGETLGELAAKATSEAEIEKLHAMAGHGKPKIFNTDQGSQFTSHAFTRVLREAEVRISMDGRGRWMDKVFIERLWRSVKYECAYLHAFETGSKLRAGLDRWFNY